ncbi:MAG TPA: hypothetical protein VN818_09495 [Gammaproteobacteria bacterium]|nr:hypothetical protein [Gammaproteobacteria bacterium]
MKDSLLRALRVIGVAALAAIALVDAAAADAFFDLGFNSTSIDADLGTTLEQTSTDTSGLHLGVGLRRELTQGSIGARLELDDLDGESLLAVRALDYRRHLSERLALTAFAGAARLDLDTPAYGYYLGGGVQIKDLWPRWSLGLDVRFGDKLARDNFDPQAPRPDDFYDLSGVTIYLSRGF